MFEFPQFSKHSVKNDVLSGLTVALALVLKQSPLPFIAGVDPMVAYARFYYWSYNIDIRWSMRE